MTYKATNINLRQKLRSEKSKLSKKMKVNLIDMHWATKSES